MPVKPIKRRLGLDGELESCCQRGESELEAWVAGGTSGIGAAIREQLAERGISSLALSNDRDTGNQLIVQGQAFAFLDVAEDPREVAERTRALLGQYGAPEFLFLSIGATYEGRSVDTAADRWDSLAHINLLGVIQVCNMIAQAWMQEREVDREWRRHIVIVGSVNAFRPLPAQGAYSVMKAALHAYAKCLANDLAPYQVRVNVIAPGAIWTPMNAALFGGEEDGTSQQHVKDAALVKRWGKAKEISDMAVWVALDSPSFLNGAELVVDGGLLTKR